MVRSSNGIKHQNIQWSLNRHTGLRKLAPLKRQRQHPSADRQARHSIWKFDLAIQIFLFWAHPSAVVTGAAVAPNGGYRVRVALNTRCHRVR
jgi:hypothetical protein